MPRDRSPPTTTVERRTDSVRRAGYDGTPESTVFGRRSSVFGRTCHRQATVPAPSFSFGSIVRMSDSSGESARAFVMSSRSMLRGEQRFLERRRARARVAARAHDERAALKHPAALAADEARERHEHAVLLGDVANQPVPARDAAGNRRAVGALERATRGRRRRHEHHMRAVERGDQSRERMPRIFAHEHRRAPPRRVERADLVAALDETLFVEQAVRRQKSLPMDVQDFAPSCRSARTRGCCAGRRRAFRRIR